jgi:hypothetical protein
LLTNLCWKFDIIDRNVSPPACLVILYFEMDSFANPSGEFIRRERTGLRDYIVVTWILFLAFTSFAQSDITASSCVNECNLARSKDKVGRFILAGGRVAPCHAGIPRREVTIEEVTASTAR